MTTGQCRSDGGKDSTRSPPDASHFLAPVPAAESPPTIDAINRYLPEVALNVVAFGGFVVGFVLFGVAMAKTASFPRPSGLLVAVGAPCQLTGSPWPSSSHRRCGPLPSLGVWPLAPVTSPPVGDCLG
jgi:hypothetical protein